MTTRILPREEWPRLAPTEAGSVWHLLNPERTEIIVIEQHGAIIGSWLRVLVPHVECLWIAEGWRHRPSVARRLWTAMRRLTASHGDRAVVTAAASDEVRALLSHANARRVPGDAFILPMETN